MPARVARKRSFWTYVAHSGTWNDRPRFTRAGIQVPTTKYIQRACLGPDHEKR